MYAHTHQLRVRYGETDQMGYVYYGVYAQYYEVGRVEALRALGITYKSLEEKGIIMPVVRLNAKYIQPARYDDLLSINTALKKLPDRFIEFEVAIFNEEEVKLHEAIVTLCFKTAVNNKFIRVAPSILEKLMPYF